MDFVRRSMRVRFLFILPQSFFLRENEVFKIKIFLIVCQCNVMRVRKSFYKYYNTFKFLALLAFDNNF